MADSIDWLALASSERAHYDRARAMQWKTNFGAWALLVFVLYVLYTTHVVAPLGCWSCWTLEGFMGLHFAWTVLQQRSLEESRARWSYYQSFADGAFTQPEAVSIWHVGSIVSILVPVGVTCGLAWAACMLVRNPPLH